MYIYTLNTHHGNCVVGYSSRYEYPVKHKVSVNTLYINIMHCYGKETGPITTE